MPLFKARRARRNISQNDCMSIMRQPQEGMGDGKGILKKRNTEKKGGGASVEVRDGLNLMKMFFNMGNFHSPYPLSGGLLVLR